MSQRSESKSNRSSISSVRSNIICAPADAAAIRTKILKYIGPESNVRAELEILQDQKETDMIASKLEILKQEYETQLYVSDLEEEPKEKQVSDYLDTLPKPAKTRTVHPIGIATQPSDNAT